MTAIDPRIKDVGDITTEPLFDIVVDLEFQRALDAPGEHVDELGRVIEPGDGVFVAARDDVRNGLARRVKSRCRAAPVRDRLDDDSSTSEASAALGPRAREPARG